jgi:hypothetical protein
MNCLGCGEPLQGSGRSDRRHHNAQCRKRAFLRRQAEQQAPEQLRVPEPAPSLDAAALIEEALAEHRLLVYVARQAQTNWRAAAWLLERRYPQRWGAHSREPGLVPPDPDPFAAVDQLAARRRLHRTYD